MCCWFVAVSVCQFKKVFVIIAYGDFNIDNVSNCGIRLRTSVCGNAQRFSVINLPSTTIHRDGSEILDTLGGYKFECPTTRVAIGLTPTSVGGRKPVCSLPVTITVLVLLGRVGDGVSSYTFVNRLSLSKRIEKVGKILPVMVGTGRYNVGGVCIPGTGTDRNTIISKVRICNVSGVLRLGSCLGRVLRPTPTGPGARSPARRQSCVPSFSRMGNRFRIGHTLRVTTTNNRGVLLVNPPNSNGDVLTGQIPSVLPSVDFSRVVRAAGVRSVTKALGRSKLVAAQPFHSPRRAMAPMKLNKKNAKAVEPNRISLTGGNILFLSRLPRFSEATLRMLHRPVRSNSVAVSETNRGYACPYSVVIITTVGPYPYKCCNSPAEGYAYSRRGVGHCLGHVSKPLLSHFSVRMRIPTIGFRRLHSTSSTRYSTSVGGETSETERVRHREFGNDGAAYGTGVGTRRFRGIYMVSGRTRGALGSTFRDLKLATETCSEILGITEAVTSLSRSRVVHSRRILRTIRCHDLSHGC